MPTMSHKGSYIYYLTHRQIVKGDMTNIMTCKERIGKTQQTLAWYVYFYGNCLTLKWPFHSEGTVSPTCVFSLYPSCKSNWWSVCLVSVIIKHLHLFLFV